MASIYNLQFEQVMELYLIHLDIEERNDVRARTLLREQYPELFDPVIFKEVADCYRWMCKHFERDNVKKLALWNDLSKNTEQLQLRCNELLYH